jgi:spermidine synthase
MNCGIGEKDVKRQILEEDVERISDVEIDPDRVEVCHSFDLVLHGIVCCDTLVFCDK